jgi:hypothetical protein
MSSEWVRILVMTYIKVLSQHLTGETGKNHEKPKRTQFPS